MSLSLGIGLGITMQRGAGFVFSSPLDLFAKGEDGAWYDPSNLSTLFQDSIGITTVTADSDPVGLILDNSQGGVGSELVTNSTFAFWTGDDTDDFNLFVAEDGSNYVTEHANGAQIVRATLNAGFKTGGAQTIPVTAGVTYKISITISGLSGVGVLFRDDSGRFTFSKNLSADGTYTYYIPANSTGSPDMQIFANSGSGSVVIEEFSMKEVLGNHALQTTAAARPAYKTSAGLHWLDHDGVDDQLVATFPDLGTDATIAYVTSGGVTILTGQTISGATNLRTEDWYGLIYLDRAFTSAEVDGVTDYLNEKAGL